MLQSCSRTSAAAACLRLSLQTWCVPCVLCVYKSQLKRVGNRNCVQMV